MTPMKLDMGQSYGVVYGHAEYQYFQGGRYFDAGGIEIMGSADDRSIPALIVRGDRMPDATEKAKAFLLQILKEGPIAKSNVWKEAENNNQSWDACTQVKAMIGITESKGPGGVIRWQLPELA